MSELVEEKINTLTELGINLTESDISRLQSAKNEVQLDNIARVFINRRFGD